MVEISLSGSGEGPGWVTAPGYSTAAFSLSLPITGDVSTPYEMPRGPVAGGPRGGRCLHRRVSSLHWR
jgi:hypothetical protein